MFFLESHSILFSSLDGKKFTDMVYIIVLHCFKHTAPPCWSKPAPFAMKSKSITSILTFAVVKYMSSRHELVRLIDRHLGFCIWSPYTRTFKFHARRDIDGHHYTISSDMDVTNVSLHIRNVLVPPYIHRLACIVVYMYVIQVCALYVHLYECDPHTSIPLVSLIQRTVPYLTKYGQHAQTSEANLHYPPVQFSLLGVLTTLFSWWNSKIAFEMRNSHTWRFTVVFPPSLWPWNRSNGRTFSLPACTSAVLFIVDWGFLSESCSPFLVATAR